MDLETTMISDKNNTPLKSNTDTVVLKSNTVFNNDFSKEVFDITYKYENENGINDRHRAIALDLASVEKPSEQNYWALNFLKLLEDFKFVPGGRITSNAGTGLKGTTYINCFVSGFRGTNQDSMDSIMDELKRQALILKSEGGYGFCADVLRPRGAYVEGIGGDSPGAVKLLEMWDTQSSVITAGSGKVKLKGKKKIRKGAQMVTLSVFHPDIEEFITAKQTPNRLTKFNMSVLVSDEFMNAVENHLPWKLEFPDHESAKSEYKEFWDGNLKLWKERKLPTQIYKEYEDANILWNLIMNSTYNRNEPGVLFVDTINRFNNLYYDEYINATNPCGEQVLPVGGCCLLGSLNLTQFVNISKKDWDYEKLEKYIPIAVRFMDNVNDKTTVPLSEQANNLVEKRRIGLGIMGYASALMMLKIRYGSDEAIRLTENLSQFIMNHAYKASSLLAKEKGSFKKFDKEKYLSGNFIKNLNADVLQSIAKYGLRNSHLLSIQPTGNSSILANNVSGGLEPLFMTKYIRTSMQPYPPEGLNLPQNINWQNKTYIQNAEGPTWQWMKEGDDDLLITNFNNEVWKMDASRGLLKESPIKDYAVDFHEKNNTWEDSADWAATAFQLNINDHIKTMQTLSKYIDSAMSKTVNVPNDYPYEDFKQLYWSVYKSGTIKGCTSYRDGTMSSVLSTESSSTKVTMTGVPRTKAIKRPLILDCDVHHLTTNNDKWVVLVGLLDKDPYEVFAMKQDRLFLPNKLIHGKLIKARSGVYNLQTDDGWCLEDISTFFESNEQEALTRMISTALRHGADIEFIVSQLIKSEGVITSFSKAIARTLKKYVVDIKSMKCSDCKSSNLSISEGCFVCKDCGSSKCN